MVFLKPYLRQISTALFLILLTSAMAPAVPYLTKIGIDKFISGKNQSGLFMMLGLIFSVLALNGVMRYFLTYIMQWVGQNVLLDIRMKLFDHIQKLSLSYYDKNSVGRLVTRVTNDVEVLNQLFSSGIIMILADVLLIFWIIGFMLYLEWHLALLTLVVIPVLLLAVSIFRNRVRVLFRDLRHEVAKMNSFLNEYITGIMTVKLFNQEQTQSIKFDETNLRTKELNIDTVFNYATFFPVVEMLSAIGTALIIWYSAESVLSGVMTVGVVIAFLQYGEMLYRPIRDLSEKYTTLQNAMASSERIFALLDTHAFVNEGEGSKALSEFKDKIEFKNVNFSYDDSKYVLKNVSFEVRKGETLAIVGATGSGKTSIISLLCRFYEYQSGEILIDGKSVRDLTTESLRKRIALVMQDVFLFSRTVAENISLGNESISREKVEQAAKALGAYGFISRLPEGFDSQMKERGQTLSGGQKQLVSFCRAFAANPEIIIMDEATSSIDSATEQLIEESLDKLLHGRTSIIIAHRLSTIKRADRIIVVHNGRIRETGSHEELLAMNGLYSRLYRLQYSDEAA